MDEISDSFGEGNFNADKWHNFFSILLTSYFRTNFLQKNQ